ncbi:hypothetical protein SAMN05444679_11040 [Variovorax sp. CF079]|uniref:saccharopine dehydrogenase n=1 Tax=Variovorax sp. CF079 TaxID=1882774 RepID=UPI00088686AC|nr:saccharopine dehydrogenase [Variovorax sp. CF079]SDD39276.1 hypothetical protein SAMN05444679_11040 [Variovorax sp. CF079]
MKPVLFIGGSGQVGSRAVRTLRQLQPGLPIAIGARDMDKAGALAREIGGAGAVMIDLARRDLGLPADAGYSAVVVLLKDAGLHSMRFAQARGLPHVSFSDFVFDIGPEVALHVRKPNSAPILLLGQYLGGTAALAALHFAREFRRVDSIAIGGLLDADDLGGPVAQADIERLGHGTPRPLLRHEGRWLWANEAQAKRRFVDADGVTHEGQAYPLLDVVSLAAATGAPSIRVDLALREGRRRAAPSHEVIVEIAGEQQGGRQGVTRHALIDGDVYSGLSARGAALAVERLLGLAGGWAVVPGLYHPEELLDPAYVVERLQGFGTEIRRLP